LRGTSCECANCGALALSSVRVFVASVAVLNGVERLLMVEHCAAGRRALRGARPNPDAYKVLTLCPPLVASSCVVLPAITACLAANSPIHISVYRHSSTTVIQTTVNIYMLGASGCYWSWRRSATVVLHERILGTLYSWLSWLCCIYLLFLTEC
jgi:hypothetical protein